MLLTYLQKFFQLQLAIYFAAYVPLAQAQVLCVGDDGHLQVERRRGVHCSSESPNAADKSAGLHEGVAHSPHAHGAKSDLRQLSVADHEHCGPCTDYDSDPNLERKKGELVSLLSAPFYISQLQQHFGAAAASFRPTIPISHYDHSLLKLQRLLSGVVLLI
ncbi:MAG: hypothetical protein KDD69_08725 [Bdellovibrionales bacterium]|nr:hypothetical protein [Bdellovibrionales bacterium]